MIDHYSRFLRPSLWLLLLLAGVAALPRPVHANAAPPSAFHFEFDYQTSQEISLEGAQLLSCEGDDACLAPQLLAFYGQCDAAGCLPLPGATGEGVLTPIPMTCSQAACSVNILEIEQYPLPGAEGYGPFKALFQFSDGLRETRLLASPIPSRATITDEGMRLRSIYWEPYGYLVLVLFVPALLFTWLVESVVLYLYLRARGLPRRAMLLWMLPLHLGTVPVVWFLFPALEWDASRQTQQLAIVTAGALLLLVAAALLYRQQQRAGRPLAALGVLALISLPLLCVGGVGILEVPAFEFSAGALTLMAEIFIFAFEAWFLRTVSLGRLSYAQAALVSLLANVVSYGGGRLVLTAWELLV